MACRGITTSLSPSIHRILTRNWPIGCQIAPGEMTVVMQHWYDGLDVTPDGFAITLNFGDAPEPLYIPYDAIRTFVDPSVEFGLRFEQQESEEEDDDSEENTLDQTDEDELEVAEEPSKDAEIVSLDSFRK